MGENSKFRSSDHEEADVAIQVISIFLNEYPNQMAYYLENVQKIVYMMNEKIKNKDIQSVALGLLPVLVKVSKLKEGFDSISFGK